MTGRIFDIQRFSVHDGPGIRTTVFLKGCPLRCAWCHNPEGISPRPQLAFDPRRCIGCGYCFRVCRRGAHRMAEGRHVLDRDVCEACGTCVAECYAEALEFIGREVSVADVMAEVRADRPFYETSGGGLTLSGGEPLAQIDFAEAVLRAAAAEGIHAAIETCGHAPWPSFERVRPLVGLFLYDWKETDPGRHKEFTGVSNELIRANLRTLYAAGARILLRCPIVPGLNDREDHFAGIASLCRQMPALLGVELLPYHRLGLGKIERLGTRAGASVAAAMPPREVVQEWAATLRSMGVTVIVHA
jgi:pyruvate formate lyase activating enzyme